MLSLRAYPRLVSRTRFSRLSSTSSSSQTVNPLPAFFLRGGTSKGIFLHRDDLPTDKSQWDRIFRGIMGSPDADYGRQLNGMGGGVSSLSKICVVGPPSDAQKAEGIDVEYTFVQVGIKDGAIDYSGNCGNLSSMIGVYAMDRLSCKPRVSGDLGTVRSFNTNTGKLVDTTFPVAELGPGDYEATLDLPQASIAGVSGKASPIILDFLSPGGARTSKLLPSGSPVDLLADVPISLVDATNPTVFVGADDLRKALALPADIPFAHDLPSNLKTLEYMRQAGAALMGLDPTAQAQPKIAILSRPSPQDVDADIVIHAYSMGVLHKAVPMTVGLCLGVAAQIPQTNAWEIARLWRERGGQAGKMLRIRHPGGVVEVGADFGEDGTVGSAKVMRTGRRLMMGWVWW